MSFKKVISKALYFVNNHSSEIMLVSSIVAGGAAIIFTAKGTSKMNGIMDDHTERVNNVKKNYIPAEELEKLEKTDEDQVKFEVSLSPEEEKTYKKELTREYVKTAGKVALNFAPAAGCALAAAGLEVGQYLVMRKRLVVALAALEAVTASFAEYRNRVKEQYGEEAEQDIFAGRMKETVEVEKTLKNGNTKTVKETVITEKGIASPFGRFFDKYNTKFLQSNDGCGRDYNREFLDSTEKTANLMLRTNGFVFLNDVYKLLGFEPTPEGQLYGWLDNTDEGDGEISFNIKEWIVNENIQDESDDVWLLDFNVDGVIFDKILPASIGKIGSV